RPILSLNEGSGLRAHGSRLKTQDFRVQNSDLRFTAKRSGAFACTSGSPPIRIRWRIGSRILERLSVDREVDGSSFVDRAGPTGGAGLERCRICANQLDAGNPAERRNDVLG